MVKALAVFATSFILIGCAPRELPVSNPEGVRLDPSAIYGFYTMDSPHSAHGFRNLCRYDGAKEFKNVTYRVEDPCGGFANRIVFGTNQFLPDDISKLVKLQDETLVGIFKMLDSGNPRSGVVSSGQYIQRPILGRRASESPVRAFFAIYELERGKVQYLGHASDDGLLKWRDEQGLAAKLAAVIPGLAEDQVNLDASITEWECSFQAIYLVSGGSWTCVQR